MPRTSPYRRALRLGQAAYERLREAWPNLHLVHLPVHASWLNQIEIYFSIVQRKLLTPNDFSSLDEVPERLLALPSPLRADGETVRVEVHPRRARHAHGAPVVYR